VQAYQIKTFDELLDQIGGIAATDVVKETVREIAGRLDFHITNTRRRCWLYHKMSWMLHWAVVLLSAAVTSFSSGKIGIETIQLTFYFSLGVTILSAVSASILPHQRFAHASEYSNKFCTFQTHFLIELEKLYLDTKKMNNHEKEANLISLLDKTNKNLSILIYEYNTKSPLPMTPSK
jgi:hypothetical protein